MATRAERKSARRSDRKARRRTAGRSPRKGKREATARRPRRRGGRTPGSAAAAPVATGPREETTAVVEGLVSYEDFDRVEREGVHQLLTGDLPNLQQWIEVEAPGRPWIAFALGMACAAIAELRGSRS